jgi:hypothetical protein
MGLLTKESSKIIPSMAKVSINGVTVALLMEIGKTIKCMGLEFSHGKMGGDMRVNTLKTRNKARAASTGLMGDAMMALGSTANSMVSANTFLLKVRRR